MKAVMYGAGNIGRGFIGQLLFESGYDVSFVDVNEEVLNRLNTEKRYPVRILRGKEYDEVWVENVSGVDGKDIDAVADAIAGADICATAVGVNVLKFIADPIRKGIVRRFSKPDAKPLNIIICENLIGADSFLKGLIADGMSEEEKTYLDKVGFVEASIGRMVPVQTKKMQDGNPLRVCVEKYCQLPVDKEAFKGEIPAIRNLVPFAPFSFYIERKLFVHNMGHATTAYLGFLRGYRYIWSCMEETDLVQLVHNAMLSTATALSQKYGVPFDELNRHVSDLLYRFTNRQLGDTVARVGGDLARKLSPNDRLLGSYAICKEQGVDTSYIELAIAAALCFESEKDEPLPAEKRLVEVCGWKPEDEVFKKVMNYYRMLCEGETYRSLHRKIQEACYA